MNPNEAREEMIRKMRLDEKQEVETQETPAEARERMLARMRGDEWDESAHDRIKKGEKGAGRFTKKGEGGGAATPNGGQGPESSKETGHSSKESGQSATSSAKGAGSKRGGSEASNGSKSEAEKPSQTASESELLINTPEGKRLDEGLRDGSISIEEAFENPVIKREQDRIRAQEDEPDSWDRTKDDPERQKWRKKVAKEYSEKYGSYSGKGKYDGPVTKGFRAEIVIGPPAGGKSSTIVNKDSAATGSRVLDSDEIKKMIPEFDDGRNAGYVQEESSHILNDMVMNDYYSGGAHCGDNIIIPIVGKKADRALEYLQKLTEAGYEVHLSFNDVSMETSLRRSLTRAIETGRHLSRRYIESIDGKCQKVYEQLKAHGGFASYTKINNDGSEAQPIEHLDKNGNPIED